MRDPVKLTCDVCKQRTVSLIDESTITPIPQRKWPWIYYCRSCKALVGCHPDTIIPLGTMANGRVRRFRAKLHETLDPLWKSGLASRTEIYVWIAGELGIEFESCHISQLTVEQLQAAIEIATKYYDLNITRIEKAFNDKRYYKVRHTQRH